MSSKLHQIYEEDLAELERTLPEIMQVKAWSARERTQIRRIQQILNNVRWNYGPHTHTQQIKPGEQA